MMHKLLSATGAQHISNSPRTLQLSNFVVWNYNSSIQAGKVICVLSVGVGNTTGASKWVV